MPDVSVIEALLAGAQPGTAVATRRGAAVTRGELLASVRARARSMDGAREWVLAEGDAVDFAALLLAVGVLGHTLHVPPNHRPATVVRLLEAHPGARMAAVSGASDGGGGAPLRLDARATVVFHTSGTTGEPTAHARPLAALIEEARALELAFGAVAGARAVSGTVPHAFIYGALFRVVWPLVSGRRFDADPLTELGAAAGTEGRLLVSSPSFLGRLEADLPSAPAESLLVFSSGSALPPDVARSLGGRGWMLREVYGSTESGGVAWRDGEEAAWTPLPGVSVVVDNEGLEVRSPHAPGGRARLSDRAEMLPDGRFRLLGRSDRIAKVEGRRVSLGALEAVILSHPDVAEAAVFPGDDGGRLAVLVVPRRDAAGVDLDGLVADLRARLAAENDLTVVPRRWRFAPEMPVDARGKRSLAILRAAAGLDAADPWSAFPRLIALGRDADAVRIRLEAPRDHPFFAGHFPGHPILPGVGLVHWASMLAPLAGLRGPFAEVLNLKFQEPTFPGHVVDLELRPAAGGLTFAFSAAGRPRASGSLLR